MHKQWKVTRCTKNWRTLVRNDQSIAIAGRSAQLPAVLLVAAASLLGLIGFFYPFIFPAIAGRSSDGSQDQAHTGDAPLLFAALTACCLAAIVVGTLAAAAALRKLRPKPGQIWFAIGEGTAAADRMESVPSRIGRAAASSILPVSRTPAAIRRPRPP